MDILVDSRQMKQCDKNTIEHFKIPSLVLMERAALKVTEEIKARIKHHGSPSALLVCGTGNNGGDGLAVGRMLWQQGYSVTIVMPKERKHISEETKTQMEILESYGIPITDVIPDRAFDVTVDAMFGIGLTREIEGIYKEYIMCMNEKAGLKTAIDIPSGIHADTGAVMGTAFRADITVTFAFVKTGLLLYPGAEYAGEVLLKNIGIDNHSFLGDVPNVYRMTQEDLGKIPFRHDYSNKGSFGKILTLAGHKNMAGAAFLSAKASYRTGAGLVKIFTTESNRTILQELLPEAILATYEDESMDSKTESFWKKTGFSKTHKKTDMETLLLQSLEWASVIVAGPGIGTGADAEILIKTILEKSKVPIILDADGLNITAGHMDWLKEKRAPVIVTPHLGEMARLTKKTILEIQKHLLQVAQDFAKEYNVICVLKDARTVIALPDGTSYINTSGNNGMATAGAGDVLTGIIAGLIAQGMDRNHAAPMGVYLHGAAADVQAAQTGTYALMAQNIIDGIGAVLHTIKK